MIRSSRTGRGARPVARGRLRGPVGAERVGVVDDPAGLGRAAGLDRLPPHRVDGAAAEPALHRAHIEGGLGEGALAVGRRGIGREHDPEVGRDRVEAAAVDDPGPRPARGRVVVVDAAPDEEHLAGEVAVVGARTGTGRHQRAAVRGVGTDRRDDHPGAGGEVGDGTVVTRVDDQQRPGRPPRAELDAYGLQALDGAPGQADPHPVRGVLREIGRCQPTDEPGRAEQDDVELTAGLGAHPPNLGDVVAPGGAGPKPVARSGPHRPGGPPCALHDGPPGRPGGRLRRSAQPGGLSRPRPGPERRHTAGRRRPRWPCC